MNVKANMKWKHRLQMEISEKITTANACVGTCHNAWINNQHFRQMNRSEKYNKQATFRNMLELSNKCMNKQIRMQ